MRGSEGLPAGRGVQPPCLPFIPLLSHGQVAGCHQMPTQCYYFFQLMPGLPLPWAEGGLPSVPRPWTMNFQETGGKLPMISCLP